MEAVTVVIPVGPDPIYRQWLPECLKSVFEQTKYPYEILLIDDQANLTVDELVGMTYSVIDTHAIERYKDRFTISRIDPNRFTAIRVYKTPWNVGVADAFNFGVALSENNLVFMLGSDDVMLPNCLEECVKTYEKERIEGWYSVTVKYMTSGQKQWIPCNTAMVTKKLWEDTGGFPPSAGVGAPDALLLSIMMKHMPERIVMVKQHEPLCLLREHDHQDTKKNAWLFDTEIVSIRNKETARFVKK